MNESFLLRTLAVLGPALTASGQVELQRIVPPFSNSGALGRQVEVDHDTAAATVSGPGNVRVLVLGRHNGVWDLDQELSFPVYESPRGLALDGDSLLVGYTTYPLWGRVLAFERSQGGWAQTQVLIPSGWSAEGNFGQSIDLDGDRAVISAPMDDSQTYGGGAIYVFDKVGGVWAETARIEPLLTCCRPFFGVSVAIDDDLIVAGQPGYHADGPNWVYAYRHSGGTWNLEAQLYETTSTTPGEDGGSFGWSVDADQTRIVVGAPNDHGPPGFQSGAVFVFEKNGSQWLLRDTLVPQRPSQGSRFGRAVALDGERLAVGGVESPGHYHESASVYTEEMGVFVLDEIIEHGYGDFGWSVALDQGSMFVGAPTEDYPIGAVYAYSFPVGVRHCDATPNSTGHPARIDALGDSSIFADAFTLRTAPVPDTAGLFFFGPNAIQVTFGDGYRCVGGAIQTLRNTRVEGEALFHGVDFGSPAAGALTAGSTWSFQAWFRDPNPGGPGFGTSDGVRVTFLP